MVRIQTRRRDHARPEFARAAEGGDRRQGFEFRLPPGLGGRGPRAVWTEGCPRVSRDGREETRMFMETLEQQLEVLEDAPRRRRGSDIAAADAERLPHRLILPLRPRDARTDDHAARAPPRPRRAGRTAGADSSRRRCSRPTARARPAGCSPPRATRPDAALPPPFEFARSIARLYLTHLCRGRRRGTPGGATPRTPAARGRPRTGRPPGPAHDRAGVPDAGRPRGLVARPRRPRPVRDRRAPRRAAGLPARRATRGGGPSAA